MRNFQDTFETLKRSFISTFSICMTVPLMTSFGNYKHGHFIRISANMLKQGHAANSFCEYKT